MQLTLLAFGTRGDVTPLVALGSRFRAAGHRIRLATHCEFEALAARHGFAFHPIPGSYQDFVSTPRGRRALDVPRGRPLGLLGLMRPFRDCADDVFHESWQASADADALICSPLASILGTCIAGAKDLPLAIASPIPPIGSRYLPAHAFPAWPLGPQYNRLTNALSARLVTYGSAAVFRAWARQAERLARTAAFQPVRSITLVAASAHVVPRPPDWPVTTQITGYWFPRGDQPPVIPPDVRDFVEAGPPPVCLGFGSMSDGNPEQLRTIVLEALARTGRRAVVVGGSGGALLGFGRSDRVCETSFVDYGWLFDRVSAVVHQGGAGTAAYCFAAGVPQVVVPYCLDHTFWAWRLRAVGVAPPAIGRHKLTAAALARTLDEAIENPSYRTAAAALAPKIAAEDGLGVAVRAAGDHFHEASAAPISLCESVG